MAFWSNWFARTEKKYDTLDLFREIYGGRATSSGPTVNWSTALDVSTVLACCKVGAEGVAQVPWKLFLDNGKSVKAPATDHPLHRLVYRKPNRWQTSFEFRETIMFHLMLMGNAYVFVGRVGSRREVRELVPLEPQFMTVEKLSAGELRYTYRPANGQSAMFSEDAIWHIRGPSWNGLIGLEAVKLAREAIGLAMATEMSQSEMHKNGMKASGAYSVDGALGQEKYDFLAKWLDKYAMGGERAGKPMILDMGAKWFSNQMTGVDGQHLETRQHQIAEICRGFRVMPIMIGVNDKAATYASSEQMFIAHVVHFLSPWYERIEQSADVNLLTEAEQAEGYYFKFTPNALMRGAAKDRAEFYTRAIGSVNATPGWMTTNEIRALEELPPIEGGYHIFKPSPVAAKNPPVTSEGDAVKHLATEFSRAISDIAAGTKALAEKETPASVVNVTSPDIKVDVAAPNIDVHPAEIHIDGAKIDVHAHIPRRGDVKKTVTKTDSEGRITEMTETELDG